jgi:hypothetical protein
MTLVMKFYSSTHFETRAYLRLDEMIAIGRAGDLVLSQLFGPMEGVNTVPRAYETRTSSRGMLG